MRDLITLFCLIHKTKTASAFAVQLDRTETFSVFKEQIVRQNQNRFKGIDPPQLRLWKVSLQIGDEDHPLHNSSNELDPMWRISKVFPTDPSEEEIHIYVDAIPMESLGTYFFFIFYILYDEQYRVPYANTLQSQGAGKVYGTGDPAVHTSHPRKRNAGTNTGRTTGGADTG